MCTPLFSQLNLADAVCSFNSTVENQLIITNILDELYARK